MQQPPCNYSILLLPNLSHLPLAPKGFSSTVSLACVLYGYFSPAQKLTGNELKITV